MAIPGNLFISVDFGSTPAADNGARPYTGTNPQWNSFSMWLDGGPNLTQTNVGTETTVKVRISNRGESPVTGVKVDAYVMNPFVGIAKPNQAIQRLSGTVGSLGPGSGGSSPTDAHVVTCSIQDPVEGPIPWKPTEAELTATVNGDGHLCLIANVYAEEDGHQLLDAEDFKVVDDQHQGQRNITLLPMQAMQAEGLSEFMVMAAPGEQDTRVAIEAVNPKLAIGAGERALLLSHCGVTTDECGELVLNHDGRQFPLFLSDRPLRARVHIDECGKSDGRLPAFRDPLRARLRLDMSREKKLGALHVFDIVQRDCKDRPLGALRVLTVIAGEDEWS